MKRFFAFDKEDGLFETFDTAEQARSAAAKMLKFWREDAGRYGSGYPDNFEHSVTWGEIKGSNVETDSISYGEYCEENGISPSEMENDPHDAIVQYEMKDLEAGQ